MEYRVWAGADWATIDVPEAAGEPLAIPIVSAIVLTTDGSRLLLQRRDRPGEPTRGLLEVPAGRWRAGESPWQALRREVAEEAGLDIQSAEVDETRHEAHHRRPFVTFRPLAVAVGTGGAVPVLCVAFVGRAEGEPVPSPGETADPRWYPLHEVRAMLDDPTRFTGPAYAVLRAYFDSVP